MGNSRSQHRQLPTIQWTHSYPRPRHTYSQVKVLPEGIPPSCLRVTDNGALLQNGGTLSFRRQDCEEKRKIYRPRSNSAHRPPKPEEISLEKTRFGSEPDLRFHFKENKDQYRNINIRQKMTKSKKKYKAPSAPQNILTCGLENSSNDLNHEEINICNNEMVRKARLFKTRAETNKNKAVILKKSENFNSKSLKQTEILENDNEKLKEEKMVEENENGTEKKRLTRSSSHHIDSSKRSLASPEFQNELREAALRLCEPLKNRAPKSEKKMENVSKIASEFLVKVDSNSTAADNFLKTNEVSFTSKESSMGLSESIYNHCYVIESLANDREIKRENSFLEKAPIKHERDVPSKKFYFGMKEENKELGVKNVENINNLNKTNAEHRITAVEKNINTRNLYKSVSHNEWEESIEKFAASFRTSPVMLTNGYTSCSSSFISDQEDDKDSTGGIALQLRPILPKKQLEIPRFSPTAAWRLLSSIDSFYPRSTSPGESDDAPVSLEERSHISNPQPAVRSIHDKSGDSGISGDASPGGCIEISEIAVRPHKPDTRESSKGILITWTPQQDLEESSSDDLESPLNSSKIARSNVPGAKFSHRSQLFSSRDHSISMSLSKEDTIFCLAEINNSKTKPESILHLDSLRKLKVALGNKCIDNLDENNDCQSNNWVLSRSISNSFSNNHITAGRSISNPPSCELDDDHLHSIPPKCPSYFCSSSSGRMMYLPEYHPRISPEEGVINLKGRILSKSCENIMLSEKSQEKNLKTPNFSLDNDKEKIFGGSRFSDNQKKRKFTFQSTVRLIENRRIADRLSKAAELKETERISEVEAMKKVEEEFQKKRAREKANIRHQLRLFNLEEKSYSSLPSSFWAESGTSPEEFSYSLPNKCTSKFQNQTLTNKTKALEMNLGPSTTQVLSEYREPKRDYKDYRPTRNIEFGEPISENNKSVVEHPKIVYDMPKSTAVYVSGRNNPKGQNQWKEDNTTVFTTSYSPHLDNYRKGFAFGARITPGESQVSSDSEISATNSQNTFSHKIKSINRSRSINRQNVSSQEDFQLVSFQKRSRSTSPIKYLMAKKNENLESDEFSSKSESEVLNTLNRMKPSEVNNELLKLSRKKMPFILTKDTHKSCKKMAIGLKQDTEKPFSKNSNILLPHLSVTSLQPFEKTGKSFRPINFNPVVRKVAQIVS